jgi:hypothetical protein
LPTTNRFLFYELEGMGQACKPSPDDLRPNKRRSIGWPPGSQDITDALTALREQGVIPVGLAGRHGAQRSDLHARADRRRVHARPSARGDGQSVG